MTQPTNGDEEKSVTDLSMEADELGAIDRCLIALLALAGIAFFVRRDTTPWGWPSLDMATFYVRLSNPTWLGSDFYTSCLAQTNGRSFFGHLTALPMRLGMEWYPNLYLLMALNRIVVLPAIYVGLSAVLPRKTALTSLVLFLLALASAAVPDQIDHFSVAWWRSWGDYFHPSLFSISAVFLGAALVYGTIRSRRRVIGGLVLTCLGMWIHPAYGLGSVLLLALCARPGRLAALHLGTAIGSLLLFGFTFGSGALSVAEYSLYFAQMHPEHYIPSRFVGLRGYSWLRSFTGISLFLLAGTLLFLWRGRRNEARIAGGLFLFYTVSLATQYVLVERAPVMKAVLILSPSRFLAFGYWMCVVVALLAVAQMRAERVEARVGRMATRYSRYLIPVTTAAIVLVAALGFARLGKPEDRLTADGRALIEWVRASTRPTDVFVAEADMAALAIPLLTGRGLYVGNGFPFIDSCLAENRRRTLRVYGDPMAPGGRANAGAFFAALQLSDFRRLPGAHWVIAKRATSRIADGAPLYQNEEFLIYDIRGAPASSVGTDPPPR